MADGLIGALEEKLEGVDRVAESLAGKLNVPVDGLAHPARHTMTPSNGATGYIRYSKTGTGIVEVSLEIVTDTAG